MLAEPHLLDGDQPGVRRRADTVYEIKEALRATLRAKWMESTTGPDKAMPEVLEAEDPQLRQKLKLAQAQCKELKPLLEAQAHLLKAGYKDAIKTAEETGKDW